MNSTNSIWAKAAWLTLLAYFFGLAVGSKEFSYFHLKFGPIPIFVGEMALFLALLLAWLNRASLFEGIPRTVRIALGTYLGWGLLLIPLSILKKDAETDLIQILRDSALFYQAGWVLFGFLLTPLRWRQWLTACLIGMGVAQYFWWGHYLFNGLIFRVSVSGFFGFLYGNESFSYFFPLTIAFWPAHWTALLSFAYGDAILGLFLIYFKKTWIIGVFGIAIPMSIWACNRRWPHSGLKKAVPMLAALVIGLLVAGYGAQVVATRHYAHMNEIEFERLTLQAERVRRGNGRKETAEQTRKRIEAEMQAARLGKPIKGPPSVFDDIRARTSDPNSWFFHGEIDESNKVHPFVAYMAWRAFLWKQVTQGFLKHPIMGNGFGPHVVTTQLNGLPARWEGKWISGPHNSFLTVAFRGGILGILCIFTLMLVPLKDWIKRYRIQRATLSPESYLAIAAFATQLLSAFFNVVLENPQHGTVFWVILGAFIRLTYFELKSSSAATTARL